MTRDLLLPVAGLGLALATGATAVGVGLVRSPAGWADTSVKLHYGASQDTRVLTVVIGGRAGKGTCPDQTVDLPAGWSVNCHGEFPPPAAEVTTPCPVSGLPLPISDVPTGQYRYDCTVR